MIRTLDGKEITIDEAVSKLEKQVCHIQFEKADKTIRSMWATKNLKLIPEADLPKGSNRKQNDTVVAVYDLEICAWRSFSKTRLKEIG